MTAEARDDQPRRREAPRLQLLWLWVLVVVLYFAWEAATYSGLFSMLAEWEFDRLGQDLPTFNFCLLTMLLAWPALALFRRRRVRSDSEDAAGDNSVSNEDRLTASHMRRIDQEAELAGYAAHDYTHFLFGFASALWFAGLVALLWTLALPRTSDNPQVFSPSAIPAVQPHEGAARLEGELRYGRISSFSRGFLFARRTSLYAPLYPPHGSDGEVHYFIEFLPAERPDIRNGATLSHRNGILVRKDLPGALIRLYRYLGYRPAARYFVLYVSPETMRWPYYVIAAQFALGGLAFALAGLWQRRHTGRIRRALAQHRTRTMSGEPLPA